jgi:hypothetical protein
VRLDSSHSLAQAWLLDFSMFIFGKFTLMLSNVPGPPTRLVVAGVPMTDLYLYLLSPIGCELERLNLGCISTLLLCICLAPLHLRFLFLQVSRPMLNTYLTAYPCHSTPFFFAGATAQSPLMPDKSPSPQLSTPRPHPRAPPDSQVFCS